MARDGGQRSPPRSPPRGAPRAGARLGQGPGLARRDDRRLPGRVRRPRRHRRLHLGLRDDGVRRPVAARQARRAVRPVRRRRPASRHGEAPRALPGRHLLAGAARLLRDDRGGPRLQRPGPAHHGDLRRRGRRVRDPHARGLGAQDVDRQRRARRPHGGRVRPADRRRRGARRARAARPAALRGRRDAPRHPDRGLRRQARARRRGQRPHLVRPRARPARQPAGPLRDGERGGRLPLGHREPDQALLLDARHAHPGPHQRVRRGHQRLQGRAHHRRPPRERAPPVRPAGRRGGDADDLPDPPAPPAPEPRADLRAALRPGAARRRPRRALRRRGRRGPQARDAGRRPEGDRHLARDGDHPGVPRVLRRPGLPARQPLRGAEGRHRRLHHLRGRQHGPAPAGRQEPADRLQARVRRPERARHRRVLRGPGVRDGRRALGAARAARPPRRRPPPRPRRRGRPARARQPARRPCAGARSTSSPASPAACSAGWTATATRSSC